MTFGSRLKEEICTCQISRVAMFSELAAIIRYDATISKDGILFTFENAAVARRVFRDIKSCFNISPKIIVRSQKRLRARQIYILEIKEDCLGILNKLQIFRQDEKIPMSRNYLSDPEEMVAFVRGAFLATGSINDPSTSGYHLEFVLSELEDASFLSELLHEMKFESKILERNSHYMVYLKNSEEISDMIRMFETPNALFYFEDVRIYRDHKNMVNRLNNCEIANQEKSTRAGMKQLEDIQYLKKNDLVELLDEKTQLVLKYREKYPESSYQELASIIALEAGYQIGKSGINHHFIKMRKLVDKHKNILEK